MVEQNFTQIIYDYRRFIVLALSFKINILFYDNY